MMKIGMLAFRTKSDLSLLDCIGLGLGAGPIFVGLVRNGSDRAELVWIGRDLQFNSTVWGGIQLRTESSGIASARGPFPHT